jgi:exodeoxyribonuclease VII small subunit
MPPSKPKEKPEPSEVDSLSYEQALAELETIVASLEENKLALEETMALYERGQQLTRHCVQLLDKAELRVKQLSGGALTDLEIEE